MGAFPASLSDGDSVPLALARSWVRVLTTPHAFFRSSVVPGEQAPGLLFAMAVVFVAEAVRIALVADPYPVFADAPALSTAFWFGVAVLLVTPTALHLIGAVQTALLIPLARDRAGVSETVQVLAYAGAPCAFAGIPIVEVRALATLYAIYLLAVGLGTVHRITTTRGLIAGAIPAAALYGYGLRGFEAIGTLLARWYII